MEKIEFELCRKADVVYAVGEYEAAVLKKNFLIKLFVVYLLIFMTQLIRIKCHLLRIEEIFCL